ncbi:Aldolase [Sphingomonas sp. EC-HK361]|uniref:HPr kinase/phosphorylase n=1 Tax=Sphingomonas sp. EC-HK361 TaxID=2038397 RepID=UPI00125B9A9B|nr:Aldolase [Sphingomonas sp. EC-HK361]
MAIISGETLHATTVAIGDRAVVIEGPSGAGKSDLALRLIDRGAVLVSDDQTWFTRSGKLLLASAPATIEGKMEVRGLGIVELPSAKQVPVGLIVRLTDAITRMPEPASRRIAGVAIREIAIDPWQHSAAIKVEMALRQVEAGEE